MDMSIECQDIYPSEWIREVTTHSKNDETSVVRA